MGVRHQGELPRRRARAIPRSAAAGVPRRDQRGAGTRASRDVGHTRPGARARGRPDAALGRPLHAGARVPSRARGGRGARGGARAGAGRAARHHRRRRRDLVGRGGRAGRAGRTTPDSRRDLAQREGGARRRPSAERRRAGHVLALVRQPDRRRSRPRLLHRQPRGGTGHDQLAGPEAGGHRDPARYRSRRAGPQLSAPGAAPRRCEGDLATAHRECHAAAEAGVAQPGAEPGPRVPRGSGSDARLLGDAHPSRADLQGDLGVVARQRDRGVGHRPLGHVDRAR